MLIWLLAPLFGATYGVAELIPRYRDAPTRALCTWPAAIYAGINAVAALGALVVVKTLKVEFGLPEGGGRDLGQVLLAGFGAMAFFRSSLFIARVGSDNIALGPVTVLQAGLDASDRGVDRHRARARAKEVRQAMANVTFAQAAVELPPLAFNLMQNVTEIEKSRLVDAVEEIGASDLNERAKTYVLGLALMRLTGRDALGAAVDLLLASQAGANPDPDSLAPSVGTKT